MYRIFLALVYGIAFLLSSCATQVSALNSYNGPWREKTNQCQVYRTSLDARFYEIAQKYDRFVLGDSHVSTRGIYENAEAAFDCMSIGANSVVVLDRGVVSSNTTYVPGSTSYSYNPYTNTYNSVYTPGYSYTNSTSAYLVVFFSKEIPYGGYMYTMEDYKSWKRHNGVILLTK